MYEHATGGKALPLDLQRVLMKFDRSIKGIGPKMNTVEKSPLQKSLISNSQ